MIRGKYAIIVICISIAFYFVSKGWDPAYKEMKEIQKKNALHERIDIGQAYDNFVTEEYSHRGVKFLTLGETIKIWIPQSRNYLYDEPHITSFIKAGDRLKKSAGSDTLFVYREKDKFYFVIDEFINKESN